MMAKNTYLSPKNIENPRSFPSISQPKIVGSFSVDEHRHYVTDARNCKYIYKHLSHSHKINYDLNQGIENVVRKSESCRQEKIDYLLQFICTNIGLLKACKRTEPNNGKDEKLLSVDIVCFRGLLRLLMCTPYENREPWTILATKYKGTIYLCALETEKRAKERLNESDETKRILSYGFKFEQYILTDNPDKKPSTDAPVIESEEFCCMFETKLNGQRILYGAEMDGVESDVMRNFDSVDFNKLRFIELKVKLREQSERQRQNYLRFKLRNWWCQCFLVNISEIIVGTRNANGIVTELSKINVKSIPKEVQNFWSPSICMEFCSKFLQLVQTEMANVNSPYDVYRFDYDPTSSNYIFMKAFKMQNQYSFLPKWYVNEIAKTE